MQARTTLFEQYPKRTLLGVILLLSLLGILALNFLAGALFGLGKTILYEAHPIYGYRPIPHQTVTRKPQHKIKMNNLGLRAESDWDTSPENKVLFLGDSVTYGGSYIDNTQLFSTLAVQSLPGIQSGNGGVNGWGVNNVAALVTEKGFLPANIVVSVFPEGDFYRGLNRIGGQPLWTRQPRFALEELFQYFIYQINLKKTPVSQHFSNEEKQQIVELAAQKLKEMDNYLKAHHCTHLIYISPTRSQVLHQAPEDNILKTALAKYGLNVIYLKGCLPTLSEKETRALFHDEIHLSETGHQVWAGIIQKDLQAVTFKER